MANYGFNFRSTSGYVSDPAGSTYSIADVYPQTRNGITFGWDSTSGLSPRDRSTTVNARGAGINFAGAANPRTFRVDLPAAGTYNIGCAMGDAGAAQLAQYIEIFDNTTSLHSMTSAAGPTANQYYDINGNLRTSDSLWFSNQTFKQLTFSTTTFKATIAKSGVGSNHTLAHIDVNPVASPAILADFPNPRGPAFPLSILDFASTSHPALRTDTFFGAPGQVPANLDLPNPIWPAYPISNRTALNPLSALQAASLDLQIWAHDWPNPLGPQFPNANRTFLAAVSVLLFPPEAMPPVAGDWPNPRGYPFPLDNRTFLAGHTALILPTPDLESWTFDWPNPRGYPFPLSNRGFIHVRQNFLSEPLPQPITYQPPLIPAPMAAGMSPVLHAWGARVTDAVNNILQGKINATQTTTLDANADTTTIIDARISAFSLIVFMPLTSSAAVEQAAGTMYVSDRTSGQATITHSNSADETRRFLFSIIA